MMKVFNTEAGTLKDGVREYCSRIAESLPRRLFKGVFRYDEIHQIVHSNSGKVIINGVDVMVSTLFIYDTENSPEVLDYNEAAAIFIMCHVRRKSSLSRFLFGEYNKRSEYSMVPVICLDGEIKELEMRGRNYLHPDFVCYKDYKNYTRPKFQLVSKLSKGILS